MRECFSPFSSNLWHFRRSSKMLYLYTLWFFNKTQLKSFLPRMTVIIESHYGKCRARLVPIKRKMNNFRSFLLFSIANGDKELTMSVVRFMVVVERRNFFWRHPRRHRSWLFISVATKRLDNYELCCFFNGGRQSSRWLDTNNATFVHFSRVRRHYCWFLLPYLLIFLL